MAVAYLIGDPVAHSVSPAMHNAAFAALGLPHRYELLRVSAEELPAAIDRVRRDGVLGANVTIPHKERVARSLDALEETARRIGAVNTLFKRAGALRGDDTDGPGFADALAEREVAVEGRRVLLLGAGGAARACADHLVRAGARVTVSARTAERARALNAALRGSGLRAARLPLVVASVPALAGFDVVVNATPLGMRGEDALEGMRLAPPLAVVDVVATAEETPLVRRARESGCLAVDGLIMLLHQGARAFRLWTELDAPVAVMRAALPRKV